MVENTKFNIILGKRLRLLRGQRKLTLTGLAEKSGISKGSLSVLEDGRGNPTITTIWRLADALGISFGELAKFDHINENEKIEEKDISVQLIEQSTSGPLMETYIMKLSSHCLREAEPHLTGVMETITILKGEMLVGKYNSPKRISTGESYTFSGDGIHIYQSLKDPVTAMISMKYPDERNPLDSFTKYKLITDESGEEDLLALLKISLTETMNGLKATRLILSSQSNGGKLFNLVEKLVEKIKTGEFLYPVHIFLGKNEDDTEIYFFQRFNSNNDFDLDFLSKKQRILKNKVKDSLESLESKDFNNKGLSPLDAEELRMFEPGYFSQLSSAADIISSCRKKKSHKILNAGSWYSDLLLREFFTGSDITTPGSGEKSLENSILGMGNEKFSLITSIGSSHYLNTAFFFQKAISLLADDGILMVSDGFIAKFNCQYDRSLYMIQHNMAYMLDILAGLPGGFFTEMKEDEKLFWEAMEREIPMVAFHAAAGMLESGLVGIKRLLQKVNKFCMGLKANHDSIELCKYIYLKLEAMIQGVEFGENFYTYPENILFHAEFAGFELVEHKRVYPTIGHGDMDAGTHVFAFIKKGK